MTPTDLLPNIIGATTMLLLTSYFDFKKREVEDKVWVVFGGIAVLIQVYDLIEGISSPFGILVALVLTTAVGFLIFYFGFYGGADWKALIVLSIFLPYLPPGSGFIPIAPIATLTNGTLLSLLLPLFLFLFNAVRLLRNEDIFQGFKEPFHRKLVACFLGYKSKGLPRAFQFPMEKEVRMTEANSSKDIIERKFDFSLLQEDFETLPGTWVTPGIPLLIFFTVGFFILLAYGDLIGAIIMFIARLI